MQGDPFAFADEWGPRAVLHIHRPALGLKAILVVDNVALGPAIGGVRMAPDVTLEECFRLARAMSLKNAAAGLPHGGAKAVIAADPRRPAGERERLVRAFARAIEGQVDYIPGPDMGTDETAMAWVDDEIGRAIGRPALTGGIPLDEIGATGFGVVVACEEACAHLGMKLAGARVAIEGFGAVGTHVARLLAERGARIVGVSDSGGAVLAGGGLDVQALLAHKAGGASVATFPGGSRAPREALLGAECEIWIPAARPDVIRRDNAGGLRARLVVPGANIPVAPEAEPLLHRQGVLLVPDFIANAGGVICGAIEHAGGRQSEVFPVIEEKIRGNLRKILAEAGRDELPREAAVRLARERMRQAAAFRRWR